MASEALSENHPTGYCHARQPIGGHHRGRLGYEVHSLAVDECRRAYRITSAARRQQDRSETVRSGHLKRVVECYETSQLRPYASMAGVLRRDWCQPTSGVAFGGTAQTMQGFRHGRCCLASTKSAACRAWRPRPGPSPHGADEIQGLVSFQIRRLNTALDLATAGLEYRSARVAS